jgi:hypothetical protein
MTVDPRTPFAVSACAGFLTGMLVGILAGIVAMGAGRLGVGNQFSGHSNLLVLGRVFGSLRSGTGLAVAVGCGLPAASAGEDEPPPTNGAAIKSVVAHFAKNGVKLEKEKEGNYWVVTDPKGGGYDVIVAWRTWPAKATDEEMQAELKMINLGFLLNAPARVAMSKPGLRSADPAKRLPRLDQVPVVKKLEKLFKEYHAPEPKK